MFKRFMLFCLLLALMPHLSAQTDPELPETIEIGYGIEMVLVKGGTFEMGSEDIGVDARPVHTVTLSDFYISKYEITQAQWLAVMGDVDCYAIGGDLPMHNVSFQDAREFINYLCMETGRNLALPTEAQWEYAARGGQKSQGYVYAGSNDLDEVGWYYDNSRERIMPVGKKKPNELGLYDMSGNLFELCWDYYAPYADTLQVNPEGPDEGDRVVVRGGAWCYDSSLANVYARSWTEGGDGYDIGVRLVMYPTHPEDSDFSAAYYQEQLGKIEEQEFDYGMKMVYVEGGEYVQGSSEYSENTYHYLPPHVAEVEGFYMGKYEVTQAMWTAVMGSNPSIKKGKDLPVHNVSWNDIDRFIRRLNQKTGRHYRLPTEKEWEYVAKEGIHSNDFRIRRSFPGGDDLMSVAWCIPNSFDPKKYFEDWLDDRLDDFMPVHPVGRKDPNVLGIHDLCGNVAEACQDAEESNYEYPYRILKGGACVSTNRSVFGGYASDPMRAYRPAYRDRVYQDERIEWLGFRLVLDR